MHDPLNVEYSVVTVTIHWDRLCGLSGGFLWLFPREWTRCRIMTARRLRLLPRFRMSCILHQHSFTVWWWSVQADWRYFLYNYQHKWGHYNPKINCNSALRMVAWPTSPSQLLIFLLCCMFLQKLACGLLTTLSSKFRLCSVEWQDDWSTVSWKK
jgi:hypothetical protein